MNKHIHIVPVGFEYDRIVLAIGANVYKVYLLTRSEGEKAPRLIDAIVQSIQEKQILIVIRKCNVNNLYDSMQTVAKIFHDEAGNQIHFNISSGGKVMSAVGMLACSLFKDGDPYYVEPRKYLDYYQDLIDLKTAGQNIIQDTLFSLDNGNVENAKKKLELLFQKCNNEETSTPNILGVPILSSGLLSQFSIPLFSKSVIPHRDAIYLLATLDYILNTSDSTIRKDPLYKTDCMNIFQIIKNETEKKDYLDYSRTGKLKIIGEYLNYLEYEKFIEIKRKKRGQTEFFSKRSSISILEEGKNAIRIFGAYYGIDESQLHSQVIGWKQSKLTKELF
jgi:hypothetical protein